MDDNVAKMTDMLMKSMDFEGQVAEMRRQHRGELRSLFLELLDVLDALVGLEGHCRNNGAGELVGSVGLIRGLLERTLRRHRIEPMSTLGKELDLELHVVSEVRQSDERPDVVLEEVQRGYTIGGKVLRHAAVVISGQETDTAVDHEAEHEGNRD